MPVSATSLIYRPTGISTRWNEYIRVDNKIRKAITLLQQEYPKETAQLFGDDPYELKNILKYWVRDHRDGDLKRRQAEAIMYAQMKMPEIADDPYYQLDQSLNVIPTDTVYLTIDKEAVKKSGMLIQGDSIPDRMVISLSGLSGVDKSKLMMLEMLANANWTRPIYVAYTVGEENYMNLGDNFVQEGLANRITPFTTNINENPLPGMTNFDTEKTYTNVMKRFKFGGISEPGVYLDETVMRMCYTHRRLLVKLAMNLAAQGDNKRAAEVLARAEKELPECNVPHDYQGYSIEMAQTYAAIGDNARAKKLVDTLWKKSDQYVTFFLSLDKDKFKGEEYNCQLHMFYIMQKLITIAESIDSKLADNYSDRLYTLLDLYTKKGGRMPQR